MQIRSYFIFEQMPGDERIIYRHSPEMTQQSSLTKIKHRCFYIISITSLGQVHREHML
uniref:Uncharacterized protein n=1 Tax=Arundo donax TaxID=35708 RepID=A0A0A9G6U6_ARUDO